MIYFLNRIATLLKDEYGDRLEKQCLVFPNRRAGLYFLKYLAAEINKPVWIPKITTINELFGLYSDLQTAESEILLFELYKVYRTLKKSPESLDEFYFWGDMLVNDFDDIDKYMVDASVLFRNVRNINEIDQIFGGLTEEQTDIIRRFWVNFNQEKLTPEKTGFLSIWSVLEELYTEFRKALVNKNIAYEGMIFRDVSEKTILKDNIDIKWDMIHFIGFNALNSCEKTLMNYCKKAGKAKFYWDYDNTYISGNKLNSAGFFLKQNIKTFGNDMPSDWSYDTFLSFKSDSVSRKVLDTSSDVAQVKLIPKLIGEIKDISAENAHHTAVVLADESLLVPLLSSLPENLGEVNITMGYPLKHTNIYTFIKHLLLLQKNSREENDEYNFHFQDVLSILKSLLIYGLVNEEANVIIDKVNKENLIWIPARLFADSSVLSSVFTKIKTPALLSVYLKYILTEISSMDYKKYKDSDVTPVQRNIRAEFIYRIMLSINRLESIVDTRDIVFSTETYIRILDKILRGQSVPFSGEPLSGIQIMGLLETRTLDFKNLIIVSVNEGILPAGSTGSSFIPFSLREAFGLPTINHQESIYAYHFYRLLQRAENVIFMYNSNSEGLRTGEMSRFLLQMKYEPALKPVSYNLRFDIKTHKLISDCIIRTEDHNIRLQSLFMTGGKGSVLSPSAINTWLNCRMRFFYRYVNRLKEPDIISSEIDPALFGTLLHDIMKMQYSGFEGQIMNEKVFETLILDIRNIETLVTEIINSKFSRGKDALLSGNELIIKEILKTFILMILRFDKSLSPLLILNLEEQFDFNLSIGTNNGSKLLKTGGVIDRIDKQGDITRIVDYKTGTGSGKIDSISELFSEKRSKDSDGWLQILLYCEAYLLKNPAGIIKPSIYRIRALSGDKFSESLVIKESRGNDIIIDDYRIVRDEYVSKLNETIETIFCANEHFKMTEDKIKCQYCPYRQLCMR